MALNAERICDDGSERRNRETMVALNAKTGEVALNAKQKAIALDVEMKTRL